MLTKNLALMLKKLRFLDNIQRFLASYFADRGTGNKEFTDVKL